VFFRKATPLITRQTTPWYTVLRLALRPSVEAINGRRRGLEQNKAIAKGVKGFRVCKST
jgi:hypothetical protein